MIILFEENETQFTSLGLGTLKDVISPIVEEKWDNGTQSLECSFQYPVKGKHFDKLKIGRFVYCKSNPFDEAQPFRICSITRPINGVITVDAVHISYDMNYIPVKPLDGQNLNEVLEEIQNEKFDEEGKRVIYTLVENKFKFSTDVTNTRTYKTTAPFNLRAILMGGDDSLLSKYEAEIKFDKFNVQILQRRGANRGAKVVYGHNMKDVNHKTSDETLYTGVFPYYHSEKTTMDTTSEDAFKKVYIVGSKPFQDGWLSYSKDGQPYHPVDEAPVQIDSEGEYYQKVYTWDPIYQVYVERIYNEQVTLIQGVMEPTWIYIDWSKFPLVICRANKAGYFKKATDTTWGELKGVGDVIFEGSIVNSGIIENMIIYYAEVIPTSGNKENVEATEIVDVQLDDPIIKIETPDAKALKHDKILTLDLTSEFDEEPSKERLQAKAEEYIIKNKIGYLKHSTTVSFVDLSKTTDADMYQNFDHIELGDTVRVVYVDAGIDIELRVIETSYDPLLDMYTKIKLGEVEKKLSASSIQTGDNVSALTNDLGFATTTQVQKIIAETITADFIQAMNAQFSAAQIKQLEAERINCPGIIEASQFNIDKLVAKMLIAENAEIQHTLTAGAIKVAGDISINNGQITIMDDGGTSYFAVDRAGNLVANSVSITGGTLDINGMFTVDNEGTLYAGNAKIEGSIVAYEGIIGGCEIRDGVLKIGQANIEGELQANSILIKNNDDDTLFFADMSTYEVYISGFEVEHYGNVGCIKAGTIEYYGDDTAGHTGVYIGTNGIQLGTKFMVDPNGTVNAKAINIGGTFTQPNMYVGDDGIIHAIDIDVTGGAIKIGGYTGDPTFSVTEDGEVIAKKMRITGGKISGDGTTTIEFPNFSLDTQGNMIARKAVINGEINATSGKLGCDISYKIDATKIKDWHNISNFITLTPDIYGNDANALNFVMYTWINFGGSMPEVINHNADYTKILVKIECYTDASYDPTTGIPSYGPTAYPPNPPIVDDYVHPDQLTLYLVLQINPDTGEIVYNTFTPQMVYYDTMPTKQNIDMNFDKVGTCAYIGCSFTGNWIISKIINQYEISKYFLKDFVQSYISSGLYINKDTLYAEKVISGSHKKLIEINYGSSQEITVRARNSSKYVTIDGDDVDISGTKVKEKLSTIETKSNKVWGSSAQWNASSRQVTLSFTGCPFAYGNGVSIVATMQNNYVTTESSHCISDPLIIKSVSSTRISANNYQYDITFFCDDVDVYDIEGGAYVTKVNIMVYKNY